MRSGKRSASALRVAVSAVAGAVVAAGCATSASSPSPRPVASAARSFDGVTEVGPLFAGSLSGIHFCTAAVVDSPGRDLVVTAAHCVAGGGTALVFAPGYHDGVAPEGAWRVAAAYADPAWVAAQDPGRDLAFLALAPQSGGGGAAEVEDRTGGYRLAAAPPPVGQQVTVVGYGAGTGGRPVRCSAAVGDTTGYPTFACSGFVDGTSGSPWTLGAGPGRAGAVLAGVIGGLHQGGCTPAVSYSAAFGAWVTVLYQRAASGAPGDTLPTAGSDGC